MYQELMKWFDSDSKCLKQARADIDLVKYSYQTEALKSWIPQQKL